MNENQSAPLQFRIDSKRLSDEVAEVLRNAIIAGKLEPGSRLLETDLADQFGVSRASVRTAIQQLSAEGIVTTVPRRGSVVASLTDEDLEEIYTIRRALESLALERLVTRITPEQIDVLERIILEIESAIAERDVAAVANLEVKFHETICMFSGHTRLLRFWRQIAHQLRAFFAAADPLLEPELNAKRHRELVAAIVSGDRALALTTLDAHITNGVRRLSLRRTSLSQPERSIVQQA